MNLNLPVHVHIETAPAGVYQLALDPVGRVWGAGLSGLFQAAPEGWQAVLPGASFLQSRAMFAAAKMLVVAGLTGGVVFSLDGGRSWNSSWVEQTNAPVNCFAASPNFAEDGAMLAGLEGDGLLRAEGGGRFWRLSNFGLRNFDIYSLLAVPPWGRRETVFAGTADGVYRSPNGGRAWKFCGLHEHVVLSLALCAVGGLSAPTLLAGTESAGLFRSLDLGENWQPVTLGPQPAPSVNALWSDGRANLAAACEDGLWLSQDAGATWARLPDSPAGVLSVLVSPETGTVFVAVGQPG